MGCCGSICGTDTPPPIAVIGGREDAELDTPTKNVDNEEIQLLDRIRDDGVDGPATLSLDSSSSPQSSQPLSRTEISAAFEKLTQESAFALINKLFNKERRRLKKLGNKQVFLFLKSCINCLEEQEQNELQTIFAGLPPGVLGDEEDRNQSRVLTDIFRDIRQCQTGPKPDKKEAQIISQLQTSLELEGQQDLLIYILNNCLSQADRFRTVMVQALLAQILPPKHDKRDALLGFLFGEKTEPK